MRARDLRVEGAAPRGRLCSGRALNHHPVIPAVARTSSAGVSPASRPEWLARCGPYAPLLRFLLWGLILLALSRLALMTWQWDRVLATGTPWPLLAMGLRCDLILLGWLLAPVAVLLPAYAALGRTRHWIRLASVWLSLALLLAVFMELCTPTFILQYDARPNRLFVEYLVYPREVVAMLVDGFPLATLFTALGTVVAAALIGWRFMRVAQRAVEWPAARILWLWPLLVVILFVMIRSSTQHRPANLATFALYDDGMVNSLMTNSLYAVLSATYGLRYESHSSAIYGDMPKAEMIRRVRADMAVPASDFVSDEYPTLHRQLASVRRERPLNLVILLEESLGAGFVQRLGGEPVTPNLDRLSTQGIWFDQLYATGTRSVRGIEAVVAGFPPTPAQSTVKLSKSQQGFATLASLLRHQGYTSEFVYGGESHFDNMRGFFLGNGFHRVIDRADFDAPMFVGDWGASDEDLFDKTDERLRALHAGGQPFFVLAFSSSNHAPFQFPDGRIELFDAPKQTVRNAVKYADHAIGRFFDTARQQAYWHDTVFLVVADHDVRVYGDALVPVDKFHIPGLILGADVQPQVLHSLASQIDLAPTLLSLMGVDSTHPFPGRDLTRTLPEFGNSAATVSPRAIMQFNDYYATLQDGIVTVLEPDDHDPDHEGRVREFGYDSHRATLQARSRLNLEHGRNALAQVLMPAWLYDHQRYRLTAPGP